MLNIIKYIKTCKTYIYLCFTLNLVQKDELNTCGNLSEIICKIASVLFRCLCNPLQRNCKKFNIATETNHIINNNNSVSKNDHGQYYINKRSYYCFK